MRLFKTARAARGVREGMETDDFTVNHPSGSAPQGIKFG